MGEALRFFILPRFLERFGDETPYDADLQARSSPQASRWNSPYFGLLYNAATFGETCLDIRGEYVTARGIESDALNPVRTHVLAGRDNLQCVLRFPVAKQYIACLQLPRAVAPVVAYRILDAILAAIFTSPIDDVHALSHIPLPGMAAAADPQPALRPLAVRLSTAASKAELKEKIEATLQWAHAALWAPLQDPLVATPPEDTALFATATSAVSAAGSPPNYVALAEAQRWAGRMSSLHDPVTESPVCGTAPVAEYATRFVVATTWTWCEGALVLTAPQCPSDGLTAAVLGLAGQHGHLTSPSPKTTAFDATLLVADTVRHALQPHLHDRSHDSETFATAVSEDLRAGGVVADHFLSLPPGLAASECGPSAGPASLLVIASCGGVTVATIALRSAAPLCGTTAPALKDVASAAAKSMCDSLGSGRGAVRPSRVERGLSSGSVVAQLFGAFGVQTVGAAAITDGVPRWVEIAPGPAFAHTAALALPPKSATNAQETMRIAVGCNAIAAAVSAWQFLGCSVRTAALLAPNTTLAAVHEPTFGGALPACPLEDPPKRRRRKPEAKKEKPPVSRTGLWAVAAAATSPGAVVCCLAHAPAKLGAAETLRLLSALPFHIAV